MKDFYVADARGREGRLVTSFFVTASKQTRLKRNGEPYAVLTLTDRTGRIEAKVWDNVTEVVGLLGEGDVVKVQGLVTSYNGRHEINVMRIRKAELSEIDPTDYLPRGPRDIEELWGQLTTFVEAIQNSALRSLLEGFLSDETIALGLRRCPAAKQMHHAYVGGLLEHICSLCAACSWIAQHYPWLDRDLLVAGAILHDIGKLEELSYRGSLGYTDRGELTGHIMIGIEMLHSKCALVPQLPNNLLTLLEHLIASHHGEKQYGSPVEPRCSEAVALHFLDQLDAKLQAIETALTSTNETWSEWNPAVRGRILNSKRFLQSTSS